MKTKTLDERTNADIMLEEIKSFFKGIGFRGCDRLNLEIKSEREIYLNLEDDTFIPAVAFIDIREHIRQFSWGVYISGKRLRFYKS